jgi:hypothetical protein
MSLRIVNPLEDDDSILRFFRFSTSDENTSRDDIGPTIGDRAENQVPDPQFEFRPSTDLRESELDSSIRPELVETTRESTAAKTGNRLEIQIEVEVIQMLARTTCKSHSRDFFDLHSQGIGRKATGETGRHGGIRDQTARRLLRRRTRAKLFEKRTPEAMLQKRVEIDRIEIVGRSLRARQPELKFVS